MEGRRWDGVQRQRSEPRAQSTLPIAGWEITRLQIHFFPLSWEVPRRGRFNAAPFLPRIDQISVLRSGRELHQLARRSPLH